MDHGREMRERVLIMEPSGLGMIGCGNVSEMYVRGCRRFGSLRWVACADIDSKRAQRTGTTHGLQALSIEALLQDPRIEIVLNLTPPAVHAKVTLQALLAGKHVYSEKPFALTQADADQILEVAKQVNRRVACAPDTFLGDGLQTCRQLLDQGAIGRPLSAAGGILCRGPEGWHPAAESFYQPGSGPLLDMGSYYLTALIELLGPIRSVTSRATNLEPRRFKSNAAGERQEFRAETDTHFCIILEFQTGLLASLIASFDVWSHRLPHLEVYGTAGTLSLPDPNTFLGPVQLYRSETSLWEEFPLTHDRSPERGIGVADLAVAITSNRPHRASAEKAAHVLEVMLACVQSSARDAGCEISTSCQRSAPLTSGELIS